MSHDAVRMVSFTGSTRAGVLVAQNAAPTVKRVAQELGGKSPNLILDDATFPEVIARDTFGVCMNTGQSCNAPTRMLVPAEKLAEAINEWELIYKVDPDYRDVEKNIEKARNLMERLDEIKKSKDDKDD